MPRRSATRRMKSTGKNRSSRQDHDLRRHVGQRHERPGLLERRARLGLGLPRAIAAATTPDGTSWKKSDRLTSSSPSAARPSRWGALAPRLPPTRVGPPVARRLARQRHHRRHEHHQIDGHPFAHERRGEPGHRLPHHHQFGATADGVDHRVGVLLEPGRVVVARQVHRHDVVAVGRGMGSDEVPVPRAAPRAGDQHVRAAARMTHRATPVVLAGPVAASTGGRRGSHRSAGRCRLSG